MTKLPPYKQRLLGWLLDFCYPGDADSHLPDVADWTEEARRMVKTQMNRQYGKCPDADALREAVIAVLRRHISGRGALTQAMATNIERALNRPLEIQSQITASTDPRGSWALATKHTPESDSRRVAESLFHYFQERGPFYGSVCQKCERIFILTKLKQKFCSDQCRWDFWNSEKMKGYYADKAKKARAHKKRIRTMKGEKAK